MFQSKTPPFVFIILAGVIILFSIIPGSSETPYNKWNADTINLVKLNNHFILVKTGTSIKDAYNLALPGDTILIEEGTYKERIILKKNNLTIRGFTRRTATIDGGFEIRGENIKIEELNFTNETVKTWPDRYTIFMRNGSNETEITDNYFFDIPGDAAISAAENNSVNNVIVKSNYIYNCAMGIDIHGNNWLVENNEVERLHNYGYSDSDYSRFHGTGHIIKNNFFHGTEPAEIGKAHIDCFQTFRGNTSNILIEGNVCYDFHQGIMSEQRDSSDNTNNITFINNVMANFKKDFIIHSHGIIIHDSDHYTIKNNTFINMGVRGILFKDDPQFPFSPDFETVKNNIFYQVGSPAYHFLKNSKGCSGGYNLLYNSGGLPDTTDIEADPMFVDYNNLDFHLLSNSAACSSGESENYIGAFPCK